MGSSILMTSMVWHKGLTALVSRVRRWYFVVNYTISNLRHFKSKLTSFRSCPSSLGAEVIYLAFSAPKLRIFHRLTLSTQKEAAMYINPVNSSATK
jgi:hypothetical protein